MLVGLPMENVMKNEGDTVNSWPILFFVFQHNK